MSASDVRDEFFESGLYYLKRSIRLLAESSDRQCAEISKPYLLEELRYEIDSFDHFLQRNNFDDEIYRKFISIKTLLRGICDAMDAGIEVIDPGDFETCQWQKLRCLSNELIVLLDEPARPAE